MARKPVVFYLAQRYGTDGTHEGMANFEMMWDAYDDFRRAMYVTSYLWAALFLVQGAATALIIRQASYATGYNYDQTLPLVATALGLVGSMAIGGYFTQRGRVRAAMADAARPEPLDGGLVEPADHPRSVDYHSTQTLSGGTTPWRGVTAAISAQPR